MSKRPEENRNMYLPECFCLLTRNENPAHICSVALALELSAASMIMYATPGASRKLPKADVAEPYSVRH